MGGVEAGLGVQGTPGCAVERLVAPDEDAREGPLARKSGILALDQQNLPGPVDRLFQADCEEDDVDRHDGIQLVPGGRRWVLSCSRTHPSPIYCSRFESD